MSYRALSQSLWEVSDAVTKYLKKSRGISNIKVEEQIAEDLARPTLHAKTTDQNYLCVEVLEDSCYSDNVDRFVSKAKSLQLPIKLFVAYPEGSESRSFSRDLKRAREEGVGVLSVSASGQVTSMGEPISQILAGVQRIDLSLYPKSYRSDLALAEQTYRQGDPPKGCLGIYEKVESLGRRVIRKLHEQSLIGTWVGKTPKIDTGAFFSLADTVYRHLDFEKVPGLSRTTWAELISMTKPRNEVGHEPKTPAARAARDKELRTRFESAAILLRHLIDETKSLKV